jgi:hypothetical protein
VSGGIGDFHREVVAAVIAVLDGHGFALAGGNALLAHGIGSRPTRDVNLFSNQAGAVSAVAAAVEPALREAGFFVERIDTFAALLDAFPGLADHRAEWTVARGGKQVMLQIASGDRARPPVVMEIGPVLDVQDVVASKVCALVMRGEVRDIIDVGAALRRFTPEKLISLAWSREPGYTYDDFTDIGPRLDRLDDQEFIRYGLTPADIADLRKCFEAWPRREGVR